MDKRFSRSVKRSAMALMAAAGLRMKPRLVETLAAAGVASLMLGAGLPGAVFAAPIAINPEIFNFGSSPLLLAFNDRVGIGRTFRNLTGDSIRWTALNVFPSPDSDAFPFACGPGGLSQCVTTNGNLTDVDVLIGPLDIPTRFAGLTSGLGGLPNSYSTEALRSSLTAAQVDFLDNNPVQFQISGQQEVGGPVNEIILTGPDYDPSAMPGFVNNITISGGGLTPTLNWQFADDPLAAPATELEIGIRRVQGNVADGTFESIQIHREFLLGNPTSYTFDTPFSLVPGETGLVAGATYEVEVSRGILGPVADPHHNPLKGLARTFFEFTPLSNDVGDVAVYLPSVDAEGTYHFDFEVTAETPVVIDPVIAVGYDYIVNSGPNMASVLLPSIAGDDGLYQLWGWDGDSFDAFIGDAFAGVEFDFGLGGLDRFRVLGIDQAALLDPTDTTAFLTTLTFVAGGPVDMSMIPITLDTVPEPPAILLLMSGLGLVSLMRLRAQRQQHHLAA